MPLRCESLGRETQDAEDVTRLGPVEAVGSARTCVNMGVRIVKRIILEQ